MAEPNVISSGKILLVDPNPKDNIPINQEDLSIFVELNTIRRGRSVIDVDDNKVETRKGKIIRFIRGSKINGREILTTAYTDLDLSPEIDKDFEGFGITNIDIEFTSSFAPIVKIDFIDVRGGSLFERGNDSDFNVFFELPYPIFELKIKGFFGKAVTYCLHLTKFNSKFNSQTGNFEVTCEFIGYTYAFLSDMLMGYLAAVVETTEGFNKLKNIKTKSGKPILTIFELINQANVISKQIEGLKNNDEDVLLLSKITKTINTYEKIEGELNDLIKNISDNSGVSSDENLLSGNLIAIKTNLPSNNEETINISIDGYKEDISLLITEAKSEGISIDESVLSINNPISDISSSSVNDEIPDNLKERLKNKKIKIYNFRDIKNIIIRNKSELEKAAREQEEIVSSTLFDKLRDQNIDLVSTIGEIFETLTAHVDIFIDRLRNVSILAENDSARNNKLFGIIENTDVPKETSDKNKRIFPWPEYKENEKEEWIGKIAPDIPEVLFVEEMLKGFMVAAKREKKLLEGLTKQSEILPPINPFDTELFHIFNPYKNIGGNQPEHIIRLILLRLFISLSYGNKVDTISDSELRALARIEANNMFANITDDDKNTLKRILNVYKNSTTDELFSSSVINTLTIGDNNLFNGRTNNLLFLNPINNKFEYEYIRTLRLDSSISSYIPLTPDYKGTKIVEAIEDKSVLSNIDGQIFFSSYVSPNSNNKTRVNDGAKYIDFISTKKYESISFSKQLPDYFSKILEEETIEKTTYDFDSDSGFNLFSGLYGTQEILKVKFNSSINENKEISSNLIFYGSDERSGFQIIPPDFETKTKEFRLLENVNIIGDNILRLEEFNLNKEIKIRAINFYSTDNRGFSPSQSYSLFGSYLYWAQSLLDSENKEKSRAFLFLHTIPFRGNISGEFGLFSINKILNLFNKRSSFIKVPKAWVLFIGGLIWRSRGGEIKFTTFDSSNNRINFIPNREAVHELPLKNQYLRLNKDSVNALASNSGLEFGRVLGQKYIKTDELIQQWPEQIKDIFLNKFIEWVESDNTDLGWKEIKNKLEPIDFDSIAKFSDWESLWNNINNDSSNLNSILSNLLNSNSSNIYSTIKKQNIGAKDKFNYSLVFKSDSDIHGQLLNFLNDSEILVNSTHRIWGGETAENNNLESVFEISNNTLTTYLNHFHSELSLLLKDNLSDYETDRETKEKIFGTVRDDKIKLILYRNFKAIYDKWVSGTSNLLNICTPSAPKKSLFEHFVFIDKAFNDISNKLILDPKSITDRIRGNYNQSFYDLISRILSDNNIDFVPLPTFVNFKDADTLKSMFEVNEFNSVLSETVGGPTFVCVYVGDTSKNLDIKNGNFTNDGIDIRIDKNGNITHPKFFSAIDGVESLSVPVFLVNYGHQNQNIFKDIRLDQQEFTETDESLIIQDEISRLGSKETSIGQNLWNVYSKRAYSCEIECMGDLMIQPMMYFQLNNIPMFHGLYLIISVKHNVKPHYVTTTFKGVRIKNTEVNLIDNKIIALSLLGSVTGLDTSNINDPELVFDSPSEDSEKITQFVDSPIEENEGLKFQQSGELNRYLILEAKFALEEIARQFNKFVRDNNKSFGDTLFVNDASKRGGGRISGHFSHRRGVDVDFRQIRTDKREATVTVDSSSYSREGTKELIKIALSDDIKNKFNIEVDIIFFNDSQLINDPELKNKVKSADGHDNHIHLRFKLPERVEIAINSNNPINTKPFSFGKLFDDYKTDFIT